MQVVIVGQGYVGLPLAIAASQAGHSVRGLDINISLIEKLQRGESPIGDLTDGEIKAALDSGNYTATQNFAVVKDADVVVICVPTPLDSKYKPDLSHLESALNSIAENLSLETLVINESTIAPGTTRTTVAQILAKSGVPFDLAYSPERIDPANQTWKVTNTPKLVAGLTHQATERARAFYSTFVDSVTIGSSLEVIEQLSCWKIVSAW